MVGNTNIPLELTELFTVKHNTEPLRQFLTETQRRLDMLEQENANLKQRVEALES